MSVFVSEVGCTFDFHLKEETQNETLTQTTLFPLAGHSNNINIHKGLESLKYNLEPGNEEPSK